MSLEEKKFEDRTIDRLMDKFTNNLDADNILDKCLSKELITGKDLTGINATLKSGRTAQAVRDLMSCVKRSSPGYLKTFCDILSDSKSSFLIPCVEEEYCKQLEANGKPVFGVFSPPVRHTYLQRDIEVISSYLHSSFEKYRRVSQDLDLVDPFFLANITNQSVLDNDYPQVLQAVPNMLHEVEDQLEGASLEASVEKYKRLCLNSKNVHSQFIDTISTILDSGPHSWKKVVMFFSSAAGFGINLHTNNMSHLATQLPVWMAQIMQSKLQPWIDDQGGWESFLSYGKDVLSRAKSMKKKKQWRNPAVNHSNKMYGGIYANWDEF